MNDDTESRKWILKQGEYRRLYSSLLQKHRGALQQQQTNSNDTTNSSSNRDGDPFAEESRILSTLYRTEMKKIGLGLGAAAVALGSLRFLRSKHAISTVFGRSKAAAMQDAEAEGKKLGTHAFQKTFANVVEGLFSLWVGYRCYDVLSHSQSQSHNSHPSSPVSSHDRTAGAHPSQEIQTQIPQSSSTISTTTDSVQAIANLPLCGGRSTIAEALCPGWIEITQQQIPGAYWKALEEGRLRDGDERIWKAIQTFSRNCERRRRAERALRRERSLPDHEPVVLPARWD